MKKGILVVSFGTTYEKTRTVTIDSIETTVRHTYPDISVYRAWTSKMILAKLLKTTGEKIFNVTEALAQMKKDGITDVYIQPTHVINGTENDRMKEDALTFQNAFHSISFGTPLLSSTSDMKEMVRILAETFSFMQNDEALILMGHGSEHYSNTVYPALDYMFKEMGYPDIHIGTVEGYPELEQVRTLLKKRHIRKVHLAPLMIVAGDHASNDMAGDGSDSWKSIFERDGYEVTCHLKGLGEYPKVQKLFLKHLSKILTFMLLCVKVSLMLL